MKVSVLGVSGMLGLMVLDYLSQDNSLELIATVRNGDLLKKMQARLNGPKWKIFDAEKCSVSDIAGVVGDTEWVVNAIGVIKPYIRDDDAAQIERAVLVNALFPHVLARAAEGYGFHVLQIATDCVYSGLKGNYLEKDEHDPIDVYGKTKSLGEVFSPNLYNLRCSIIGPELKSHVSLLDWFLGQPQGGTVTGFTNQLWNGVTTLNFAKLCQGIIKMGIKLPHIQHIVPAGTISKADMLKCFVREYRRQDIKINEGKALKAIDRTLATANKTLNRELWAAAGYVEPPSVPEMINEMAAYKSKILGV